MGAIHKLAALAALVAASSAVSAVTAQASLSNLKIQVFDLNPADAVSPSFSIVSSITGFTSAGTQSGLYDFTSGVPASAQLTASGLQLSGMTSGDVLELGSLMLSASANVTMPSPFGYSYAQGQLNFQIEVGAGTLVLISADTSVAADGNGAPSDSYVYGYSSLGFYENGNGVQVGSSGFRQVYTGFNYANLTPSSSGPIAASFANFTAGAVTLSAQAYSQTWVQAPAIPEPASGILLLGGLGLMIGTWKRRQMGT